ncbi:hypothetical protein SBRY_70223 [Actinacidiphila bryophytorum]|uniref:Uncharacterized protein n=1 Tax=Actinacidiphila bryophytorum TaxID=1436133 RepID=A0A9W4H7B6_9ACTN|nr:hypothetical protein SBRY_70223 [Actinacidiphila bryophytorum]
MAAARRPAGRGGPDPGRACGGEAVRAAGRGAGQDRQRAGRAAPAAGDDQAPAEGQRGLPAFVRRGARGLQVARGRSAATRPGERSPAAVRQLPFPAPESLLSQA